LIPVSSFVHALSFGSPGTKEDTGIKIIEHDITEVNVKNKNFSSPGEIAFVSSGLKEWETLSIDDVSKVADRLTVFGIRLEAEGRILPGYEEEWRIVQRGSPLTDHFESGEVDSIGMWRWEEKDGLRNGYYTLRIFGMEEEEIAVSLHLAEGEWTPFTPPLTPGPDGSILFGKIEIGTGGNISTKEGTLELKIKNASKTGAAHFDFIRLDPLNTVDGRINVNTASKKVLGVLPGVSEEIAEDIITNRVYGDKNSLGLGIGDLISSNALGSDDLAKKLVFKQISNLVTVHCGIYRIIVTGQVLQDGKVLAEKKIWVVFER